MRATRIPTCTALYLDRKNNPDGFGAIPLTFMVGSGSVLPGLEEGVIGMTKVKCLRERRAARSYTGRHVCTLEYYILNTNQQHSDFRTRFDASLFPQSSAIRSTLAWNPFR